MDLLSVGVFVVYLASLLAIALYASKRSKSTSDDYFVGRSCSS